MIRIIVNGPCDETFETTFPVNKIFLRELSFGGWAEHSLVSSGLSFSDPQSLLSEQVLIWVSSYSHSSGCQSPHSQRSVQSLLSSSSSSSELSSSIVWFVSLLTGVVEPPPEPPSSPPEEPPSSPPPPLTPLSIVPSQSSSNPLNISVIGVPGVALQVVFN